MRLSLSRQWMGVAAAGALLTAMLLPGTGAAASNTYTVQPGDTLTKIAHQTGTTVSALASTNNIVNPDRIYAGQVLTIPGTSHTVSDTTSQSGSYTVQTGDTLGRLAARWGTTVSAIVEANNISNPNRIYAGQVLVKAGSSGGGTFVPAPPPPAPAASPAPAAAPVAAPAPQSNPAPASGSARDQFAAGFRSAGGSEAHLQHLVNRVIPCESTWNVYAYNPAGPYYGLLQFLPATWASVGGGDWFDPYQQGVNAARLIQRATPQTQWPVCWNR